MIFHGVSGDSNLGLLEIHLTFLTIIANSLSFIQLAVSASNSRRRKGSEKDKILDDPTCSRFMPETSSHNIQRGQCPLTC